MKLFSNDNEYIIAESMNEALQISAKRNAYDDIASYLHDWPIERDSWHEVSFDEFLNLNANRIIDKEDIHQASDE